jgi:hypothetical protein
MQEVDKGKQKLKRYNEKIRELKKEGGIKWYQYLEQKKNQWKETVYT